MRKQNIAKGGGLEPKVKVFKICVKLWRRGEVTNITQIYPRRESAGGVPSRRRPLSIFRNIL